MRSARIRAGTYDVLIERSTIKEVICPTAIPGLDIVPTTMDLSGAEIELVNAPRREYALCSALRDITPYDYILIDCPPSLGLLTLNALTASDAVLIPLQCEFYALEGLSHLLRTIRHIQQRLNPALRIQGVVLTMYDRRNRLTTQVEEDVRSVLGTQVYRTVVPRNVRLAEAPSHGQPALVYDMACPGSRAYLQLAREVLTQEGILPPQSDPDTRTIAA